MFQTLDGLWVLCPHIEVAFVGADGISTDHHAFQHRMRIALQGAPVHEGAGVSFVRIADDIFLVARSLPAELPLHAGEESAAAPAPEAGVCDDLYYLFRRVLFQHLLDGLVAPDSYVLIYGIGINDAAIPEDDPPLFLEKGIVSGRSRILYYPLLHGAVADNVLRHDTLRLFRCNIAVQEGVAGLINDFHQRFAKTHPVASGLFQHDLDVLFLYCELYGLERLFSAGRYTTGPKPDFDRLHAHSPRLCRFAFNAYTFVVAASLSSTYFQYACVGYYAPAVGYSRRLGLHLESKSALPRDRRHIK